MKYFNHITKKKHWRHSDVFDGKENEYIKSFIHGEYSMHFHTHSFYELNIVLEGIGTHLIEQMTCPAKKGYVFVIPPNVRHSYQNLGNLDVYHMLIHRDFFKTYLDKLKSTLGFSLIFDIEPYLRAKFPENQFLMLNDEELSSVLKDINEINLCDGVENEDIFKNAIACKIITYLCLLTTKRQSEIVNPIKTSAELKNITDSLNYIHQNFEEHITINFLAERLNMSRSSFIRHFTKICGCSPHQYIKNHRLKIAKQMLNDSSTSITEISQRCGFYDASHLRKYLSESE